MGLVHFLQRLGASGSQTRSKSSSSSTGRSLPFFLLPFSGR